MNRNKAYQKISAAFIVLALLISPLSAYSATQTISYNNLSINEKIAYLYGMIAQIQAILDLKERTRDSDYYDVIVVKGRDSRSEDIEIETLSASDIRDVEADLRGRIDLDGERSATVWFEYGEDDDDLDMRTSKRNISNSRGDVQSFTINVDGLDDDERYYFRAVGEDRSGDREYGQIRSFTTDDRGGSSGSGGDFSLEIRDTSIDVGDEIKIDWEIPSREEGSSNWIGLYERGDSNSSYLKWKYLSNDDSGTVSFQIYDEGVYEVRLFLNNSYDDEVTSERITVN